MARVIFISGACGCGKTTFVNAYSRYLVSRNHKSVYVIHGDDFRRGFVEPEDMMNWSRKTGTSQSLFLLRGCLKNINTLIFPSII